MSRTRDVPDTGHATIVNAMSVDVEDYFHVSALASVAPRDRWETFERRVEGNTGRLIDGQHRLMAIAESGIDVLANVVTGAREELREYPDTGISPALEDRVEFMADPNTNKLAAILVNNLYAFASKSGRGKPTRPVVAG